jgi:hypothetical protein
MNVLTGIAASSGIGIGPAWVIAERGAGDPRVPDRAERARGDRASSSARSKRARDLRSIRSGIAAELGRRTRRHLRRAPA